MGSQSVRVMKLSQRALALASLCIIAACAVTSTVEAPDIRAERVSMTGNLARYLTVEEARLDLVGGVPSAQVTVRNGGSRLKVNHHFIWFDSNGVQVGSVGDGGRDDVFLGGETKVIRGLPPFTSATQYKLVMRHR